VKVLIIGAGPAGLSCGYELSKKGVDVAIYEASEHVGGMSRSIDLWGQKVDLGPHRFFSKEKNVNRFFNELLQDEYTLVNRQTRIFYRNRFFDYPLKFLNVLTNLSLTTIIRILWDYLIIRLKPIKNPSTFEEWVTNKFGKKLFETFFKSYSEKLWGIPCSKIDANWAAQRIKSLSLIDAIIFSIKGDKKNKHKTLVDQFAYPKNGTGQLYLNCAKKIIENGGEINLNSPARKIVVDEFKNATGIILSDGTEIKADIIISTMPLTTLVKGFSNLPNIVSEAADELYFRNTILVYLEVDDINLFKDNWIYVHSPDVKHGRITNFRNWCPTLYKDKQTSILCLEFWAFDTDEIWEMSDVDISNLAKKELRLLKLVPEKANISQFKVVKIPKCYPVYEIGYETHLKVIEKYISEFKNIIPIGRYGAFKYNNQDHSILMGILAAENITGNKNVNLWNINTDTEYQEDGFVKDVLIQ
jgi:protoporphyrinogen oxidase